MRFFALFVPVSCMLMMTSACSPQAIAEARQAKLERTLNEMKGPVVPNLESTLKESAEQAEKNRQYETAASLYLQLAEKYQDNVNYPFALAENLRKAGKWDDAEKVYEKAAEKKGMKLNAYEGWGLALMEQGQYEEAADKFADVMQEEPNRWKTVNAIGILFAIKQMYPEARQYFGEAVALEPKNVAVRNNWGLMEAMDHKYDDALRMMQEASQLAGREKALKMRVDLNTALIYAAKGELANAEKVASPHLTESQLLNNMGLYAYLAKDENLAKSYLSMALTSSPKHYDKAWQNLETMNRLVRSAPAGR